MKTNVWLTLIGSLATSVLAQQVANPPPAATVPARAVMPAPAAPASTPAKAKKKAATKSAKKTATAASLPALMEKPVFLSPGPATITGNNVNVRGQATIYSEVVTRLNSGDRVTVIEQVIRDNPKAGDPTQWAKIAIPPEVRVWVHGAYIDATKKVVLPRRLNVRTGPGENYSIVGLLEQGAPVKEVSTKGNWIEIEAPADTFAFVAAMYVKQAGAAPAVPPVVSIAPEVTAPTPTPPVAPEPAPTPAVAPEPAPMPAVVPEPTPVATTTTETPAPTPSSTPTPKPEVAPTPMPPMTAPSPELAPAPPPFEEPPPKRIVQHEGVVKGTLSIQAPTRFALVDPVSRKTVNYLYTSSTNLDLSRYKGLRIVVTGEESLDERWKNTPVITIQRIQVIQ